MTALVLILVAALTTPSQQVTRIVITKSDHTLALYHDQTELNSYRVSLGSHSGAKQQAGDRRTPEGLYIVDAKNPSSQFHRALHLSYPNDHDRARAKKLGVDPGGDIEIHGQMNSFAWLGPLARHFDWTAGCIALTNGEIDATWPLIPVGTPVEIKP